MDVGRVGDGGQRLVGRGEGGHEGRRRDGHRGEDPNRAPRASEEKLVENVDILIYLLSILYIGSYYWGCNFL